MGWKYRIIERRMDGGFTPFGVAYEHDEGGIYLFSPLWRGDRILDARSIDDLDQRHVPPSGDYRWARVQTSPTPIQDPSGLLEQAFTAAAAPTVAAEPEPSPTGPSLQDVIKQMFGVGGLAFARQMGDSPELRAEPEPSDAPPLDLDDLARQAEHDPELGRAIQHLRAALAKPEFRATVLLALEAFARAADGTGVEAEST